MSKARINDLKLMRDAAGGHGGLNEEIAALEADHLLKTCETCDAFDHVDNRVRGYVDAGDAWDECDECRNEA